MQASRRGAGRALISRPTLAVLVGDVPGVPTTMGLLVVLTAVQALVGREELWLPGWLARRSVGAEGVRKAVGWLRPAARVVDGVVTRRLDALVGTGGDRALAVLCLLVGAAMPAMELVPFSANLGGLVLTLVGLAWIARDGALAALLLLAAAAGAGLLIARLV